MERKTLVITGASRGIGRAAALAFARKGGYNLVLNCRKSEDAIRLLSDELEMNYDVNCLPLLADVSDPCEVQRLFREAREEFGSIYGVINNAALSWVGLLSDMSNEEWNRIVATNLSSVFYCSREAIPDMLHQKSGRILNVSSVWGNCGASCEVAYSATKGAVNAFTRALAKELAPSKIAVNAVAFGCIDTEMNAQLSEEEKAELAEEIPAGKFASPQEAGDFILRIFESDTYLTGQVIAFDGGWI